MYFYSKILIIVSIIILIPYSTFGDTCVSQFSANKINELIYNCEKINGEKAKHKNCANKIKGVQQFIVSAESSFLQLSNLLSIDITGITREKKVQVDNNILELQKSKEKISGYVDAFENNFFSFFGACFVWNKIEKDLKKREEQFRQKECPRPNLLNAIAGKVAGDLSDIFIDVSCDTSVDHKTNDNYINQDRGKGSIFTFPLKPNQNESQSPGGIGQ